MPIKFASHQKTSAPSVVKEVSIIKFMFLFITFEIPLEFSALYFIYKFE